MMRKEGKGETKAAPVELTLDSAAIEVQDVTHGEEENTHWETEHRSWLLEEERVRLQLDPGEKSTSTTTACD